MAGCVLIVCISALLAVFELALGTWGSHLARLKQLQGLAGKGAAPDVLVMYVFSNSDSEYLENLKFFLREGVHPDDGCEYLFIVNRSPNEEVRSNVSDSVKRLHRPDSLPV